MWQLYDEDGNLEQTTNNVNVAAQWCVQQQGKVIKC